MSKSVWLQRPIAGVLLDVTGVLYDSGDGDGCAVPGSVDAINRLQSSSIKVRFVSNESTNTRQHLVDKLKRLGFQLSVDQLFTPAPACRNYLLQNKLRPHLLVHPDVLPEFSDVPTDSPNCVVLGDAQEFFTWENMNTAFQKLLDMDTPVLLTLGAGKYYKETDGLKLDVGSFAKALEHALDIQVTAVLGKPSDAFFDAALNDMKLTREQVVMIGDDIVSDVGGAQRCGLRGVQVRTGKWRPEWEQHPSVRPDAIVDNLADAVNQILAVYP